MPSLMRSPEWLALEEAAHAIPLHDHYRLMRLMHEYVAGMRQLAALPPSVAIFGSARTKSEARHYAAAAETARLLAHAGFSIITGGGPGIMEAANRGAQEGGARSIGLPIHLAREESPNAYMDVAIPYTSFAPRKAAFLTSACAFVVFPGGLGTLDELLEVALALQTGKISRAPLILYDGAFWGGLRDWLRQMPVAAGTMDVSDLDLLSVAETPEEVVAQISKQNHQQGRMRDEGDAQAMPSATFTRERVEALP